MTADDLTLSAPPVVSLTTLIHRSAKEVFQAFTDPAVTTRFWFTKSSGALAPGATVRWEWEMFGGGTGVMVTGFEPERTLVFVWNDTDPTTVTFFFEPEAVDRTVVRVTETGFTGTADERVAKALGSTAGFAKVLCAAKALLEHDVVLTVVADHRP